MHGVASPERAERLIAREHFHLVAQAAIQHWVGLVDDRRHQLRQLPSNLRLRSLSRRRRLPLPAPNDRLDMLRVEAILRLEGLVEHHFKRVRSMCPFAAKLTTMVF